MLTRAEPRRGIWLAVVALVAMAVYFALLRLPLPGGAMALAALLLGVAGARR